MTWSTRFMFYRSSRPEVFLRTGVLKTCCKFALQLCWNHTSAWVFSSKFEEYFQSTFPQEHLSCFRKLLAQITNNVIEDSKEFIEFCKLYKGLKVLSAIILLVCFVYLKESICETRKNIFISLRKLFSFLR